MAVANHWAPVVGEVPQCLDKHHQAREQECANEIHTLPAEAGHLTSLVHGQDIEGEEPGHGQGQPGTKVAIPGVDVGALHGHHAGACNPHGQQERHEHPQRQDSILLLLKEHHEQGQSSESDSDDAH